MQPVNMIFAICVAKIAMRLSKLLGKGRGSSFPGVVALKLCPSIIQKFASQLRIGSVLVTGTNGKTTSNNMLAQVLSSAGYKVLYNQEGANLETGVASAFIKSSNIVGRIDCDYAVLEVDEAAFPKVSVQVSPRIVLITNFFRDQLDRYGELDTTIQMVKTALYKVSDAKLVLNADDPLVAHIAKETQLTTFYYGITSAQQEFSGAGEETREAKFCPFCGEPLQYKEYYYSQLGDYYCLGCDFYRPEANVRADRIYSRGNFLSGILTFYEEQSDKKFDLKIPSGGLYNYYNALAAFTTSFVMGVVPEKAINVLSSFVPVTGRMEQFQKMEKSIFLNLVKNPTGFNQSLFLLIKSDEKKDVLMALNDNDADGRDISWVWDVNFEMLEKNVDLFGAFVCTGQRAEEMALRLKYAGVPLDKLYVKTDTEEAVSAVLTGDNNSVFLLATYTALWPVESILSKKAKRVVYDVKNMSSVS